MWAPRSVVEHQDHPGHREHPGRRGPRAHRELHQGPGRVHRHGVADRREGDRHVRAAEAVVREVGGSQEAGDRHDAVGRCDLRPDRRRSTAGHRPVRDRPAAPERDHRNHPGRAVPGDADAGHHRSDRAEVDAVPVGQAAGEWHRDAVRGPQAPNPRVVDPVRSPVRWGVVPTGPRSARSRWLHRRRRPAGCPGHPGRSADANCRRRSLVQITAAKAQVASRPGSWS